MATIGNDYWSTEIPDDWSVEEDDTCLTVWRQSGGALQFSTAHKDGDVTADDLNDFAEEHLLKATSRTAATFSHFEGYELQYDSDGNSWRIWYLMSGSMLLFVTYYCSVEHRGSDDDEIDAIMEKLFATPNPHPGYN